MEGRPAIKYRDVPPVQSFSWPEGVECALCLTFDDAKPTQVDRGLPLLDEYGAKATFYVVSDAAAKDADVWRSAVANGHEIGNHTLTHPCSGNTIFMRNNALEDYTLDRIAEEIEGAQRAIEDLLGVTPRTFAFPCGHTTVGRGTNTRSYCVPIDRQPFREARRLIDDARSKGGWLILASHHVGHRADWQMTLETTLREICEYAREPDNGIWLDTVAQVAQYVCEQRRKRD